MLIRHPKKRCPLILTQEERKELPFTPLCERQPSSLELPYIPGTRVIAVNFLEENTAACDLEEEELTSRAVK